MELDAGQDDILGPVANKLGVPTDMLIFFGGEGFCLICAVLYYKYLPASKVGAQVRHVLAIALGLLVGFFSFGIQFFHVITQSVVCFVAIMVLPQNYMHIVVFLCSMSYLVILHLYRAYMIPEDILYSIDVSGPLMIVTQKISSLAFSIHDGFYGNKDKLSDLQKRYRVSKPPSMIEYFSYIFYFQGIVVGPLSFYNDYVAFVEGTDIVRKTDKNGGLQNNNNYASQKSLSPFPTVFKKMSIAIFWMIFHFTVKPLYPELLNAVDDAGDDCDDGNDDAGDDCDDDDDGDDAAGDDNDDGDDHAGDDCDDGDDNAGDDSDDGDDDAGDDDDGDDDAGDDCDDGDDNAGDDVDDGDDDAGDDDDGDDDAGDDCDDGDDNAGDDGDDDAGDDDDGDDDAGDDCDDGDDDAGDDSDDDDGDDDAGDDSDDDDGDDDAGDDGDDDAGDDCDDGDDNAGDDGDDDH
ncbi:hypothetical protein ACF0H5_022871 [Mactra antiquata]